MSVGFLSVEAEMDILADKLDAWASDAEASSVDPTVSDIMRYYWTGRAEAMQFTARSLRRLVDDSRPVAPVGES